MSKGIGAYAEIVSEDETTVKYKYGGYNLNDPKYKNEEHLYDGTITIRKDCFVEPEIHEKIRKQPNGKKKLIVKRIPVDVDYPGMIEDERITIENCSNCWHTTEGDLKIDVMVLHLLFWLFRKYQEEGKNPDSISYNV